MLKDKNKKTTEKKCVRKFYKMEQDVNLSYGRLLHLLEEQPRELYRKLEKNRRKLIQNSYSGQFNQASINENLLPKYSKKGNRFDV